MWNQFIWNFYFMSTHMQRSPHSFCFVTIILQCFVTTITTPQSIWRMHQYNGVFMHIDSFYGLLNWWQFRMHFFSLFCMSFELEVGDKCLSHAIWNLLIDQLKIYTMSFRGGLGTQFIMNQAIPCYTSNRCLHVKLKSFQLHMTLFVLWN